MTRPLASPHDGLTPAERERYEAARDAGGGPPQIPGPTLGAKPGPEPIGELIARLKLRNAAGALVVARIPNEIPNIKPRPRAKTGKEQKERDAREGAKAAEEEPTRREAPWTSVAPVQGIPGRFLTESAKEAE